MLSISADTRQIQRQLKSLVGQTQANTRAIEDAFGGIDKASSGAFDRVAANSNRAFTTAEQGARRYQTAMRGSQLQTANLAAQLNDIGVQLAGGQSPFLIALQQGTQITQALGPGAGLRGTVAALGGAFASILNPVSLVTIALIALGGEAISYFASLISGSKDSAEALKQQEQIIRSVADRWGEAVPALREYVEELDRAKQAAELQTAGEAVSSKQWDAVNSAVDSFREKYAGVINILDEVAGSASNSENVLYELATAYAELTVKTEKGIVNQEDFSRVQNAATKAAADTGYSEIIAFASAFDALSGAIDGPLAKLEQLQSLAGRAAMLDPRSWRGNDPASGKPLPGQSVDGPIQNPGFNTPEFGPTPDRRPLIEIEGLPGDRRASSKAASEREKAIRDAEREKKAVVDLIEQLEFEQSLLGMTAEERAEANALRRAGAAATDEQRAKISQLVEATYAEREAIKANEEAMRQLQEVSRDVLEGIVSDLADGKSGADILASALKRVGDMLLSSAFDSLFPATASGGRRTGGGGLFGGAIIPGILHSGGVAGSDGYGHGRSVSPSVFASAPRYHNGGIAGLKPDEVPAILQRGERVIPRGQSGSASASSFTYAPTIDARGATPEAVAALAKAQEKDRRDFKKNVIAAVKEAQGRRGV